MKDWFEAEWFDGLVKIPLLIDNSSIWYANLQANGQTGGYCLLDNNSVYTVTFKRKDDTGAYWFDRNQDGVFCDDTYETLFWEDGASF